MPLTSTFGTLNVHRADCNRDHPNPCDPWPVRLPRVVNFLRTQMRCSLYAFQECLPQQAADITQGLGWASAKNPAAWSDENFNVIAIDRQKWTDLLVAQHSLARAPGDLGDRNRRSVNWVWVRRIGTPYTLGVGSAHLETGNPADRAEQALSLVETLPAGGPLILGIDRNSYTSAADGPRAIFAKAGLTEAVIDPTSERSFNGFAPSIESDGKRIDGIHYRGLASASAVLRSTVGLGATDHSGLRMSFGVA
jgi:hypothetical protein